MFTGIISAVGRVRTVDIGRDARWFEIESPYDPAGIAIGASIAHAGCCLTVVERGPVDGGAWHSVEVSQESLDRTSLGAWMEGSSVNLERSLCAGDELGGHMVSGHVDGVAVLAERTPLGGSLRLVFDAPGELARFIAAKGSVTLDGVSLTVNEVTGARFSVNIIPHTGEVTTLGALTAGDRVNLEVDLIARYLARLNEAKDELA